MSLFNDFLKSSDSLRIYDGDRLLFTSKERGIKPLVEYIDRAIPCEGPVKILDKVVGNAAALLSVKAGAKKVYGLLGSEIAVKTLDKYNVECDFIKVVPYIQNNEKQGICPFEKLSIDKSPSEFYEMVKQLPSLKGKREGIYTELKFI